MKVVHPRGLAGAVLLASVLAACNSQSGPSGGPCTLPAASSLSVVKVDPPQGATGVFAGTNVSVTFNTCLDPGSLTATSFLLASGTALIAGSLSHDVPTARVIFDPSADLAYSSFYTLAVNGIRGAHGETMAAPFGSFFQTQAAAEFVPPTSTASPPGGRYNATQAVTLTCADNPGGTGCAATYYTSDGSAPTTSSTLYTGPIAIANSTTLRFFSKDGQGNAEAPRQEIYVIDKVPPTLAGSDPANGATGVTVNQVITASFSEEMSAPAFNGAVSFDHGVAFTLTPAGSALTITPRERLACNTTYHVAVGAGASDVAGNALTQPAAFTFTTIADCQEPATVANVPGGVYSASQSVTLSCTDLGGSGCARIVYTIDGSLPSLDPVNGTVVSGASAGPIAIDAGDTVLRFFAEDVAGNREVVHQQTYTVTTTGLTFVATNDGIARGAGPVPANFIPIRPGGRTRMFFRDPSNGRFYRATERGLLVSDAGDAWTFVPTSIPAVLSVFAQGSKILAGTSGGLLVSTDGGASFSTRNLGAPGTGFVTSVLAAGEQVYAATDHGVAVSSDKGQTFVMRTTTDGLGSISVRRLALSGSTLYAATSTGLSISTDGGTTFVNYATGLASASMNDLAVSGTTVYAATDLGLSISSDGGHTFNATRTTANGLANNYVSAVVFDGTRLYVATGAPFVSGSTNSFAVSTDATGASFTARAVSPSHPDLTVESVHVEGATVRVGAHPAYYLSADGGVTFAPKDLRGSIKKITGTGANVYAAIQEGSGFGGVAISTDSGQSFTIRGKEDGLAGTSVDDVYVDGTNVYAVTFGGLGVSTNGGTSFTNRTLAGSSTPGCVQASGTTIWVGATNDLQKSVSGGAFSTIQASTGIGNGIAVSGTGVYLATSTGLWVSNTSGASGSFTLKGTADGLGSASVSDVAVDGNGKVLAATSNGLSVSANSGASFTNLTLPATPKSIFASGTTWYASTSLGLAISTDGGATWLLRGDAAGVTTPANDAWFRP